MYTISYNFTQIPIKSTPTDKILISNKDLADICFVYELLVDSTRLLNPTMIYKNKHYVKDKDTIYWTAKGIIRICLLLSNPESLEFADFMENIKY